MCSLSDVKKGDIRPPDGPRGLANVFSDLISCWRFKAFFLTRPSVLTLGGGPEERGRAQVRPPLHGAARLHRGVCSCAGCVPADGTRHGGSQKVPVPCESVFCL